MKQREQYRLIRYGYYHAGRVLHLMGSFYSACIMLGYAVETTMKAGLLEIRAEVRQNDKKEMNRILKRSHDVKEIYRKCREHSLFDNVGVSGDFLKHIDYHYLEPKVMIVLAPARSTCYGNRTVIRPGDHFLNLHITWIGSLGLLISAGNNKPLIKEGLMFGFSTYCETSDRWLTLSYL